MIGFAVLLEPSTKASILGGPTDNLFTVASPVSHDAWNPLSVSCFEADKLKQALPSVACSSPLHRGPSYPGQNPLGRYLATSSCTSNRSGCTGNGYVLLRPSMKRVAGDVQLREAE